MTEAEVKKKVDKIFKNLDGCWIFKPVSNGMGRHGIPDYVGCYKGHFFAIETKKPGRRGEKNRGCSALQMNEMRGIGEAGGVAFVVDCEEEAEMVASYLKENFG